jgi:predicted TIM-barrel fold metal-dependent hydrolase
LLTAYQGENMSDIWTRVRAGEILAGEVIIDCHTHMGPWFNFSIPRDPWAEGMLWAMDTCGIDRAVSAPHWAIANEMSAGNQIIADVVAQYPDRFLGYCTISPHYPSEEIIAEMDRHLTHGNLSAIKIHPNVHHTKADGPNYRPMWEFAHERSLTVLSHTWESASECNPKMFAEIAKEFPNVSILLGHAGGTPDGMDESIAAAKEGDALYLDLTGSQLPRGMLEVMVREVGAERILFGTDIPFVDCRPQIGYVAAARISDDEKRLIFGGNAQRLFGLKEG